jgi:hypothetical protein
MIMEVIDIPKLTFNNTKSVFTFIIKIKIKFEYNLIMHKIQL